MFAAVAKSECVGRPGSDLNVVEVSRQSLSKLRRVERGFSRVTLRCVDNRSGELRPELALRRPEIGSS
jgi:hypothetical protein